jgi:hypothetical protein
VKVYFRLLNFWNEHKDDLVSEDHDPDEENPFETEKTILNKYVYPIANSGLSYHQDKGYLTESSK